MPTQVSQTPPVEREKTVQLAIGLDVGESSAVPDALATSTLRSLFGQMHETSTAPTEQTTDASTTNLDVHRDLGVVSDGGLVEVCDQQRPDDRVTTIDLYASASDVLDVNGGADGGTELTGDTGEYDRGLCPRARTEAR